MLDQQNLHIFLRVILRDISLLDESITLTSAVQLSGYPSVVGTLWQVMDDRSSDIASKVYKWVLEKDGKFDNSRSAEALHKAIRDLREKICKRALGMSDPLPWAPFIHIGI